MRREANRLPWEVYREETSEVYILDRSKVKIVRPEDYLKEIKTGDVVYLSSYVGTGIPELIGYKALLYREVIELTPYTIKTKPFRGNEVIVQRYEGIGDKFFIAFWESRN